VRTELWGYATDEALSNEDLIAEKYRGIRPAPGYPACPDHRAKRQMFEVLKAAEIGMGLTESLAMTPAACARGALRRPSRPGPSAAKVTLVRVAPLVVGADELLALAMARAAEAHAAVGTDVLDHVQPACGVAHQDHRALAHHRALEVARVRRLGLEADAAPVTAVGEALELAPVQPSAGVGRNGMRRVP
jgi:hypothetical protein